MPELIDIVDETNKLTGETMARQQAHVVGAFHRSSHVLVYNSKGEVLLQLRAENKKAWPNIWDVSVAGHVAAGEQPIEAAIRELQEEIGLSVAEDKLEFCLIKKESKIWDKVVENEFLYVYLFRLDDPLDTSVLQTSEVQKTKFIPIDDAEEELRQNDDYMPHVYWSEIFEQVRQRINL